MGVGLKMRPIIEEGGAAAGMWNDLTLGNVLWAEPREYELG
jgi:hypothetical protein